MARGDERMKKYKWNDKVVAIESELRDGRIIIKSEDGLLDDVRFEDLMEFLEADQIPEDKMRALGEMNWHKDTVDRWAYEYEDKETKLIDSDGKIMFLIRKSGNEILRIHSEKYSNFAYRRHIDRMLKLKIIE